MFGNGFKHDIGWRQSNISLVNWTGQALKETLPGSRSATILLKCTRVEIPFELAWIQVPFKGILCVSRSCVFSHRLDLERPFSVRDVDVSQLRSGSALRRGASPHGSPALVGLGILAEWATSGGLGRGHPESLFNAWQRSRTHIPTFWRMHHSVVEK